MVSEKLDALNIMEYVSGCRDQPTLVTLMPAIQHHRNVLRGEVRRLEKLVQAAGSKCPHSLRRQLADAYDQSSRFGRALEMAKINLKAAAVAVSVTCAPRR